MILDKLMEKKDLKTYIEFRTKRLKIFLKEAGTSKDLKDKQRFAVQKQIMGRIKELQALSKNIDNLKDVSKMDWKELHR